MRTTEHTKPSWRNVAVMAGPFDEVLDAEEKMRLSGYEVGLPCGRGQGLIDGFATGFSQGVQIADEVGYYLGFAEYMLELIGCPLARGDGDLATSQPREDATDSETKAKKALQQVIQYISEFHCLQLSSPSYQDNLNKIRTKFKQVTSLLKLDQPKTSAKSLDF